MPAIKMPYGQTSFVLDLDDSEISAVVRANKPDIPPVSQARAVREAIGEPICSPKLEDILHPGEKVCLIVPDITRLWESTTVSTPLLLDAINRCGIRDEDITILCASGTHRKMTDDEHRKLLGDEIVRRFKIVDHQCEETENLKFMGTTSRNTPVYFNRHACEADKVITSCGIVYHFLAGFGGGGKMLLPGISGSETIQHNHELALNPGLGEGDNPHVCAGNIGPSNPLRSDINEAAAMLAPCFALNVVVNDKFQIIKAFAGDWLKSHEEGCRLVAEMDGVKIPEKSDLVIASAGGSPKDINLYQGIKLLSNAMAAARPGATIILVAQFPEGFGNKDCETFIRDFKDMKAREKALRDKFSIGAFSGFLFAEACEKYNLILVSEMPAKDFANTKAHPVASLDEALKLAKSFVPANARAVVMPHGATTLPKPVK